jgi:pimeloyl-ACP methyl ester carboxylesterase
VTSLIGIENAMPTDDTIQTIDRFVTHVSTVPANLGQTVGLHLREKVSTSIATSNKPPVVLFVHGGFSPSNVAYDLEYKNDYSFMRVLARAGYDVFAMTHTAYGSSPKPMMDDPCNVDPAHQHHLIPHVLKEVTKPRYLFKLVSSRTEHDEVETVVKFIMNLRKVERISMIGWSTGTPRAGGFAAMHPDKVDKLVLYGPAPYFPSDTPPNPFPEAGTPMILQSWDMLMEKRWHNDCRSEGQIEHPEIREFMWQALMKEDGLGAHWTADGRGIMRAPNRMNYGWRANIGSIKAPTLFLLGEFDNYVNRLPTWGGLKMDNRAFIKVGCASHFMQYERVRFVLHKAALEWLANGTVQGQRCAELQSDRDGQLSALRRDS